MKLRQVMKLSYPLIRRPFGATTIGMEPKVLIEEHSQSVFEFKLNTPKTLNAIDVDMCNLMIEELKNWRKNPDEVPRVLMVSGCGKAFCAGGDVVNIYKSKMGLIEDKNVSRDFFAREYLLDYTLSQMKKTRQISIWNGICMGGGVGLTWHSPVRIATDNSMYAMPETAIGFFCDVGGSYFLSRMKDQTIELGLYIGLTGQRVKNRDLVKWGIATHFVPADKMSELYKAITHTVTKQSTDSEIDEIVKYFSDEKAGSDPIENYDQIKAIFKPDSIQEILDRLTASNSDFAAKTLKTLGGMSPLALCVVFEQIVRGHKMNVKEVFKMEYGISQGFMNHTEFFEGVRAKLVDKTNEPNWKFKSVDTVPRSEVEYFFNQKVDCPMDIDNDSWFKGQ